jgi:hypothetical protein
VTIALEIARRERLFALAALAAAAGFAVSLPLLNVDAFIVRHNIARELAGATQFHTEFGRATLDSQYFLHLSDDAVPPLVAAYQSQPMSDSVKEKLGAALACIRYERSRDGRALLWQSFHWSRFQADRALSQVEAALDAYTLDTTEWPVVVTTPAGDEYSCSPQYID